MKKLFVGSIVILILIGIWFYYLRYWPTSKPSARAKSSAFENYKPPRCAEIFEEGKLVRYQCPFNGVRIWKSLGQISKDLQETVVMLEDAKFWSHSGLDVEEIVNSIEKNLEKKKFARGGSTITQQLAKNLFLWKDKSIVRKASEVPLALMLERELTKPQILELYLNAIEWGEGIYGAEAASRHYFDKGADELTEEEAWLLAIMIPNPKELNLWTHPKAKKSLLNRARHLTWRFINDKKMANEEADAAFERFELFLEAFEHQNPKTMTEENRLTRRFPLLPN